MKENAAVCTPLTDGRPLHWQEIVAEHSADDLPFREYFEELLRAYQEELANGGHAQLMNAQQRVAAGSDVVDSPAQWTAVRKTTWGVEDGVSVDEWFEAGEALQHSNIEVQIYEPDPWEIALHWIRSLAVATLWKSA